VGILGKVDMRRGTPQIVVEEVRDPEEMDERETGEVHIRLDKSVASEEAFYRLRAELLEYPGNSPLFIHVSHNGNGQTDPGDESVIRASGQLTVSSRQDVLDSLKELTGVAEAWKQ
jgi:DNA polymerase-3 subunit alpha